MRCWVLKLIPRIGKQIFKTDFIVFVDHKVTYRKAEEHNVLNGTDTLDT